MFDEFRGLPLHPLVVHATVVLLPVTALLGVLFVVPRLRMRLRWPLLAASLASLLTLFVTRRSGEALQESLNLAGPVAQAVERHQELADQLVWLVVALAVVAVVAAVAARPTTITAETHADQSDGRPGGQRGQTAVQTILAVLVLLASVAVAVQTARVGEAGSRAVWNPTGDASFSGE